MVKCGEMLWRPRGEGACKNPVRHFIYGPMETVKYMWVNIWFGAC